MAEQWQGRSRGGKTGYQIFIFLIRHCGIRAAYFLLFFVSLYFIAAAPSSTADIWRYARRILGYGRMKSALFIFRSYYSFGQSIIDKVAISSGLSDRYHYDFEGFGALESAVSSGRGTIVIGAHFGNWAAGEPFFRKYGTKLNLVMYDNEHSDIKELLEKNKASDAPFRIIPVNKDNLAHVFMITEALDRGELVCFLGDRYVNEDKLIHAQLLGHDVKFPYGPFCLAAKMHVPVLFYFSVREPGMTYRFTFTEAEQLQSRNGAEENILAQFIGALEKELEKHPEQWYNYYDFWGLRDGASSEKNHDWYE